MRWQDLKRKTEAPGEGWMLAYTREQVLFHSYKTYEEIEQELAEAELLELHLFDKDKEYRCLSTRSRRFPDGVIETVEDFVVEEGKKEDKNVYKEQVLLAGEWKGKSITILNHVSYDEKTGMASIDNYRLRM